jgi:hypothetical protein
MIMNAMRMRLSAAIVLAVVVLVPGMARSQEAPGPRRGQAGAPGAPALPPGELERWFDSYVLLQAQDTLQLTDAQFARVLPALKGLQAARRRGLQSRRQLVNSMAVLLKATPVDEASLQDRLRALRELDAKSSDDLRRAYDALDAALDTTQQARFRLFEEQVERRKLDLLMRARQRAGARGAGAPESR